MRLNNLNKDDRYLAEIRQEAKCISRYRFLSALPFLASNAPAFGGAKPAAGCPERRYRHGSTLLTSQKQIEEKTAGTAHPAKAVLTPPTTGEAIKESKNKKHY